MHRRPWTRSSKGAGKISGNESPERRAEHLAELSRRCQEAQKVSEEKMARLNEVYGERSLRDRDNGLDWHLVCALLVTKAGGRMELDEREYHYAREWARRGYSITRTDEDRLRQLIVIEANPDLRGATMPPSQYMAPLVSKPPPAADDLMKQLMQTIAPPTPPAKVPPTKIDFTPEPPPPPPGPVKKRKRSEASRTRIHNDG